MTPAASAYRCRAHRSSSPLAEGAYEIRVKGPIVTPGYFARPDLTAAAFDEQGFYRSGDAVAFADPQDPNAGLVFRGRLAEDFKLTTGTYVRVGAVRLALLSATPMLSDAVIAGENREYACALAWLNAAEARRLLGEEPQPRGELIVHEIVLVQYPADPATADIAVTVVDDWQGRGAGTALVSALLARRPAAVTRLRTLVAAGNRASLALLARAGRVSAGLPERGVLDVTVELPAATRARTAVENVAGFWAQGARKLIDQTYMFPRLPQAGLIPAVERYFEFMQRMAEMNRDLTVTWVQAASALSGLSWEQAPAEPGGDVVRKQAATAGR